MPAPMPTPHKVLVVDDTDDSRQLAVFVLEHAGFAVTEAATGMDALALAGATGPDVVVLDVHLPDIDGFEVCRRLKLEPKTRPIPVLFLSATYTDLDARMRGRESGAEAYLTKPCEPAELVSAVKGLVRLREAEAALRTRDSLLAIARVVGGTVDTTEALRLVCRELARLTGADTVGVHLLNRDRDELRPVAGYRIPKDALDVLARSPVSRQPFWPAVVRSGEVVWSDDVLHDERFEFHLFRAVPHQSGLVIPLVVDGEVGGTFYLVWWKTRRRVDPSEAVMLQTIGQQVGVLLRNARLIEEAEVRRRIAEAAKEHYRLLFERNLAGVFRSRGDGRLVECNEAFARLLGYRSREETLQHNAWDFYADPVERDRLLDLLGSDRRVANHETRWRRANGEEFTVMMNATQIGEGRDAHLEGIVLDITDRKRAEEALREREMQLRSLGDNLPDGVIYQVVRRVDGSNYFPYMSSGLEHRFGLTASEAMIDAGLVYRMVLPEDLQRIRAASDESIQTGGPVDVEYRMRTASGEIRWMNLRGRPRRLADGATQWDVVALDITDRKRAEEVLREHETQLRALADTLRRSEERYRLLFERSFVGIFRTRSDGIVTECNDAFARILGYDSAADLRGRSVIGHYATPEDRAMVVARLAAGEDVIDSELIGRRRDGVLVPVAMSARRIQDQEGSIHEGILVDLTDRKRAEEAAALRSVAELSNAAAHEINNPLTVILGQLELIPLDGRNVGDRIEQARTAVFRIRDIVDDMVRITRLEPSTAWSRDLPPMLDIRRSGAPRDDTAEGPNAPTAAPRPGE
jgi:PAS domain S-box-containing protein